MLLFFHIQSVKLSVLEVHEEGNLKCCPVICWSDRGKLPTSSICEVELCVLTYVLGSCRVHVHMAGALGR